MKYLLLHGLRQSSASWDSVTAELAQRKQILRPNLANWIRSKEPTYANLYQALEEYCNYFVEPLHLCGNALGGMLALQYGAEHPEKVKSLVLIDTFYKISGGLSALQALRLRVMPESSFPSEGFGKKQCIAIWKSMRGLNLEESLEKLSCPVRTVRAQDSRNGLLYLDALL